MLYIIYWNQCHISTIYFMCCLKSWHPISINVCLSWEATVVKFQELLIELSHLMSHSTSGNYCYHYIIEQRKMCVNGVCSQSPRGTSHIIPPSLQSFLTFYKWRQHITFLYTCMFLFCLEKYSAFSYKIQSCHGWWETMLWSFHLNCQHCI